MKIGVILPSISANSTGQPSTYVETRRWAQDSEPLGFDSIWINDHLLFRFIGPATARRTAGHSRTSSASGRAGPGWRRSPRRPSASRSAPGSCPPASAIRRCWPRWRCLARRGQCRTTDPRAGRRLARPGARGVRLPAGQPGQPVRGGDADHRSPAAHGRGRLPRHVLRRARLRHRPAWAAAARVRPSSSARMDRGCCA